MDSATATEQAVIPGAAVTRVSRATTIAPGGSITLTNNCPTGSVVVGGGFLTQNPNGRAITSRASGNGWTVTGINVSSASTISFNTEAECLTGTRASQTQANSQSVTLRGNSVGCLTATCPTGSFPVGGGWTGGNSLAPYISEKTANGTGWGVCAKNTNFFQSTTFQSFATCLKGVTGSASAATVASTINANSNKRIDSPPCTTGLLLGSGGFRLTANGRQALPITSARSFQDPTKWSTIVLNTDPSLTVDVTVSGICLNLSQ